MKFVIMKSGFGSYWISKFDETKVKLPKKVKEFSNYDDALQKALSMNDSIENEDELISTEENEIEELSEDMLRWIA